MIKKIFFVLLFAGFCLTLSAQTGKIKFMLPDSSIVDVSKDTPVKDLVFKHYKKGELKNGVQYYIAKNSTPQDSLSVMLHLDSGRMQETENTYGYSSLIQKLLLTTSADKTNKELEAFLQGYGFNPKQPYRNAYINFSGTFYTFDTSTKDPKKVEDLIAFLAKMVKDIKVDNTIIENEKFVLLEEAKKMSTNEGFNFQKRMFKILYYNSVFPDIVYPDLDKLLKDVSDDKLKAFFKEQYRPEYMSVFVSGNMDTDKVEKMIQEYFSMLPASKARKTVKQPVMHHHENDPQVDIVNSKIVGRDVGFQYNVKISFPPIKTLEDYIGSIHLSAISEMLANRFKSFPYQTSPFKKVLGGDLSPLQGQMLNDQTVAVVKDLSRLKEGLEKQEEEIKRVSEYGFTKDEFDAALNVLKSRVEQRFSAHQTTFSNKVINSWMFSIKDQGIAPLYSNSEKYLFDEYYSKKITVEDVNAYLHKIFKKRSEVVVVFADEKTKLPSKEDVKKIILDAQHKEVSDYVDSVMVKPLIKNYLSFGKVLSSKDHGNNITEVKLSNGANIVFRPTPFPPFKSGEIVDANEPRGKIFITGMKAGGSEMYDKLQDVVACVLVPQVVAASGLGEFTTQELTKKLKDASIYIQPLIATNSEMLIANSGVKDLETLLKVIYLYFTAPRVDEDMWHKIIQNASNLHDERYEKDPTASFRDEIHEVMTQGDKRSGVIPKELYSSVSMERAKEIFAENFGNANGYTFFVTGDFKLQDVQRIIERYLSALPDKGTPKATRPDHKIGYPKGKKLHKETAKGIDKSFVMQAFVAPLEYSMDNLALVNATVAILTKRLEYRFDAVEKLPGLKPSVTFDFLQAPNNYVKINISYSITPTIAEKTMAAVRDEIKSFKQNIDSSEFDFFKENYEKSIKLDPKKPSMWIGRLQFLKEHKMPYEDLVKYDKIDETKINIASIKKMANLLLGDNLQEFLLEEDSGAKSKK